MKLSLFLVLVLAVHGEISTVAKRMPSGASTIEVRSEGAVALSAVAIRYQLAGQEGVFYQYFDELTDAAPPKSEFVVELPYTLPRDGKGRIPALAGSIANAAILSDGTATGEPELIRRLVLRRANLLQTVEASLDMIAAAGRHNTSRSRMIADSVHRWYLPEEQQTGFRVYQSIVGKLTNMVEGPVGTAFPSNEFVEQETAALNRQRTVLMASQPSLADVAQNGR